MPGIGVALGLGIVHAIRLQADGKSSRDPRAAVAPSTTAGDIRS
jgi:hypothetical protein